MCNRAFIDDDDDNQDLPLERIENNNTIPVQAKQKNVSVVNVVIGGILGILTILVPLFQLVAKKLK